MKGSSGRTLEIQQSLDNRRLVHVLKRKRSGPAKSKKRKGDDQKVLVRGPEIPKGQAQGEKYS